MYQEAGIHLDKSAYYTVDDQRPKTPSRHEGATAENILRWEDIHPVPLTALQLTFRLK